MKKVMGALSIALAALLSPVSAYAGDVGKVTDQQLENIVRRSYQYVAMYNVIQKFALDPSSDQMFTDGFNKPVASSGLANHHMMSIARPNNDTLYQLTVLDLRQEPVIVGFPAIDSKYAVLQTSGYDHYPSVPLATTNGDFSKPEKVLFYTERTQGYDGEKIAGVDRYVEVDGDFTVAFLRVMPHQADPERMATIIRALNEVSVASLSEYRGGDSQTITPVRFPGFGETDIDTFTNNLPEVIQFVFDHVSFDVNDAMDHAVLEAYAPFGIGPNSTVDKQRVTELRGPRVRATAEKVVQQVALDTTNPELVAKYIPQLFMPKGDISLPAQLIQ